MRLLQSAGYAPRLAACGKCGTRTGSTGSREVCQGKGTGASSAGQSEYHNFYVPQGTVICSRCFTGEGKFVRLSHGAMRFHESLLKWDPSAIDRVNAPGYLVEELMDIIDAHISYVLGPSRFAGKTRKLQ